MQQPDYFIDDNGLPSILNRKSKPKGIPDNKKSVSHQHKPCEKLLSKRDHTCHNTTISVINNVNVKQIQSFDKSTKDLINQRLKESYCAIADN